MSDIQLDFDRLHQAKGRVDSALATFQSAGRVGDDVAGLTGESRLAGKVRDFAGNWDYNRGKLEEQLTFLAEALGAIVDTMTDLDSDLAAQAAEAAPESVGTTRPGGAR